MFGSKILSYTGSPGSRDSVVGIATGYGLDDRGVGVRVSVVISIFPFHSVTHPAFLSNGYRGYFPGGRVAGA
jgi:hypothetical protein